MRRTSLLILATTAVLLVGVLPAAAGPTSSITNPRNYVAAALGIGGTLPGPTLAVEGHATGVLTSPNTVQVIVECNAVALPGATLGGWTPVAVPLATAITKCYVWSEAGGSAYAPSLGLPGAVAATAGTKNVGLGVLHVVCEGKALFSDGRTVPGSCK
ncbi:MAG: hypothetical protein HY775_08540 [Acidobacteria bacterium]|nr:hypothetical protein [Acidobacteriota bacterium]